MRSALILLVLVFAILGALFGALNSESVVYDFYFAQWHLSKGATLLFALLIGWLLGGLLVYAGLVLRLRHRLRAQVRELKRLNQAVNQQTVPQDEATTALSAMQPRDA